MYKAHDSFETPPPDAGLWKYVDFTKFVSLLEKEALFGKLFRSLRGDVSDGQSRVGL